LFLQIVEVLLLVVVGGDVESVVQNCAFFCGPCVVSTTVEICLRYDAVDLDIRYPFSKILPFDFSVSFQVLCL
jgi:hypothetical protein